MLPLYIYLVRHGQSESNVANSHSRAGDNSCFTEEFACRHTAHVRLTDKGREQARAAGEWFRRNNIVVFDRCYVSEYVRARETAALLNLPNIRWFVDPQLRERDYGLLEHLPDPLRRARYPRYFELEEQNKFYTACPGGESMADVCNRIRNNILSTLHREMAGRNSALIVCHGNIIEGFRVALERISADEYNQLMEKDEKWFKIGNGQIVEYTRVNPEDPSDILPHMGWVRSTNPYDPGYAGHGWRKIDRRTYTNEELLEMVSRYPQIINNE